MRRELKSSLVASLVFAAVAAAAVALAEAQVAVRYSTGGPSEVFEHKLLIWRGVFGLLAPIAVVAGAAGAAMGFIGAPALRRLRQHLGGQDSEARALRIVLPLMGLSCATAIVLVAHLALRWFLAPASHLQAALGFALSTAVLLHLWLRISYRLSQVLARGLPGSAVSSAFSLSLTFLLFFGPLLWGAITGNTGGVGSFWGLLGVLQREGIHYLVPLGLGGIVCAGSLPQVLPAVCRWRPALSWPSALATSSVLVASCWGSHRVWLNNTDVALPLERAGGSGALILAVARRLSDQDGDGFSPLLGGGDCDDIRVDVYPGAPEVRGNGIDESCSGADLPMLVQPAPPPPPIEKTQTNADWLSAAIGPDLNIVFLTVDTLRHDLGYMGYRRPISPNIDRLAARSVVFERAYSLASYTGKSMGPMLIGRYTSETHRGWWHFNHFDERETFVQERLQAAGVRTIGVQGHWYFTPKYGIGRGFDVNDTSATPRKHQGEGDRTVNSNRLTDAAIAQLSEAKNTGGRFFLWAHYLDPHAEYMRHPQYNFGRKGRDLYDSEVAFTDHHIGRLLDFIRDSEFSERTAIIITSDHGEAFGENKMWRHGNEVWETLVRVPLVVYVPGAEARRHTVRRSAIDLVPTILELFGMDLPTGKQRLSGHSLVKDIFMPPNYTPEKRAILVDMSAGPYNSERRAFITQDQKLITSGSRTLGLYDLAKDPREARNLARKPELLKPMKKKMEEFLQKLRPVFVKPR